MPSPADQQSEANAQVELIARAFYEEWARCVVLFPWEEIPSQRQEVYRGVVRALLRRGAIQPGVKLPAPEMAGQTSIEEQLGEP